MSDMKTLQFTVTVEGREENVSYLKHLILGALRLWDDKAKVHCSVQDVSRFEEEEMQAVERGELGEGL